MGGFYNTIFGYNQVGCLLLAPMLTDENPEKFFPRFRDCFLGDDGDTILIYTRVGGGNRCYGKYPPHDLLEDDWYDEETGEHGFGEDKLYRMPTFLRTWDDDEFDGTYGYYEFGVPDEWREDFERVRRGEYGGLSEAYVRRVHGCYPRLDVAGILADWAGEAPETDDAAK